jgi:tousled-like kinase
MLYGKKPYGEGKSQEKVLTEGIILNAHGVDFPANPKVSDEARDFIKVCLTHDQRYRPDVLQLCQHPYIRNK